MTKKDKALIILAPAFATDESDSKLPSQEVLVRMINRLYPSLKVIIIAFHFPVKKTSVHTWHGNTVITLNGAMKGKIHSLVLWRKVWKTLGQLEDQYDLAGLFSFFCSECAFIGHYFAKRHKLIHKIWVLGQDALKSNHQVRRIKPRPEELITISDFLQSTFEHNHGIRPAHVIPIGIDPAIFPGQQQERSIDLLGAGSLIPLKQYDQFLDVVDSVKEHIVDLKAVLLGNGPEEQALKLQSAKLHLDQTVSFPGRQSHTNTLSMMQRCKVFLHTSSYEGLGVVCLEALYAGAQVISYCKPMQATIPGWHIVQNKEEMAAKATALLKDETPDYTGAMPYSMEDTARKIMQLFGM